MVYVSHGFLPVPEREAVNPVGIDKGLSPPAAEYRRGTRGRVARGCFRLRSNPLRFALMSEPALATSGLSPDEQASMEEDARLDWEASRDITENGPFAPGDTSFAIGHYSEDRLAWFDILSVTLDDIIGSWPPPLTWALTGGSGRTPLGSEARL